MARLWFDYAARERYVTDGVNDAWMVTTASLGREGSAQRDDSPFLVANEWIAGNLAWFLRLPVPPFALMRRRGQKCMFTSLHYDPRNNVAPGDCDPEILAKRDPETSTGIILFDILIANFDRHRGNLKVDSPDDPTQVFVIDNERGVFAHMPGDVPKRFVKLANKLGISGTKCDPLCSRHCLLDYLPTSEFMLGWWGLIQTIPDHFINRVCEETVGVGVTAEQAEQAALFLRSRKHNLQDIIKANTSEFKSIAPNAWGMFP